MSLTRGMVMKECRDLSRKTGHSFMLIYETLPSLALVYTINVDGFNRCTGSLRECLNFLNGVSFTVDVITPTARANGVDVSEQMGNTELAQKLNTELAQKLNAFRRFYISARKTAKDTYFSQQFNKYYICITGVCDTSVRFLCNVRSITPSGIPDGSVNENTGELIITLDLNDTMNSVALKMLKAIDNVMFRDALKERARSNHNVLLWITPDRRKKLGWTNDKLDTVDVDYKICSYK